MLRFSPAVHKADNKSPAAAQSQSVLLRWNKLKEKTAAG